MLAEERDQNYRVQKGGWKLPVPEDHVLTPKQRKRLRKKERSKSHAHFPGAASCDRCRPSNKRDLNATTASTGPVNKWQRT